jgi:hypothetical protein
MMRLRFSILILNFEDTLIRSWPQGKDIVSSLKSGYARLGAKGIALFYDIRLFHL